MEIQTTRFGRMEVNEERIITFPRGLLGFPSHTRYALIQTGEENYFFWLQSVDEPGLFINTRRPPLGVRCRYSYWMPSQTPVS